MRSHQARKQITAVALAVLLMLVPGLAQAQTSGQPQGAPPKAVSPSKAAAAEKDDPRSGPQEGIKVHGHWTIVLKNPDGTVASRHEFENALIQNGQVFLAAVLSRSALVASWHVLVDSAGGVARPCNLGGTPGPCDIGEPNAFAYGNTQNFPNLALQVTGTNTITLTGSAKSANGGNIQVVSTVVGSCSPTVSPSACPSSPSGIYGLPFTNHDLGSAITVQAGQTIDVTVVISFS